MTVTTTTNRVTHSGNGVTVEFSVPFKFFADGDLTVDLVYDNGTIANQTLDSDYTVTAFDENTSAGAINFSISSAPSNVSDVLIVRDVDFTQGTDLVENDPLPAEELEKAVDRNTILAQQAEEKATRTIRLPDSDALSSMTLDSATDRANKFLAFDANGNLTSQTLTIGTTNVSTFMSQLLDDDNTTEAQTTLGISAFMQTVLDDANATAARTTLGAETADADILKADTTDELEVGYSVDESVVNISNGTHTVDHSNKGSIKLNVQGNCTIAPDTTLNGRTRYLVTFDGAHTVTTSGFNHTSGSFNNSNGSVHLCDIHTLDNTARSVLIITELT